MRAFQRVIAAPMLTLMLVAGTVLHGCGGGGGNSNGSLALAVTSSNVGAGQQTVAVATYTPSATTTATTLNNLKVSFVSSDPTIISNAEAYTNSLGIAQAPLQTHNVSNVLKTITVVAKVGDLTTAETKITVTPATLTLTAPAAGTFAVKSDSTTKTCASGQVGVVPSGAQVKFVDPTGQPVYKQTVQFSVDSISNGVDGLGEVIFYPGTVAQFIVDPPPPAQTPVVLTTDANGVAFIPLSILAGTPSSTGGVNTIVVQWLATTTAMGENNTPLTYAVAGQSSLTVTCN